MCSYVGRKGFRPKRSLRQACCFSRTSQDKSHSFRLRAHWHSARLDNKQAQQHTLNQLLSFARRMAAAGGPSCSAQKAWTPSIMASCSSCTPCHAQKQRIRAKQELM